jgi:DNA sulfur modification protein DndD
MLFEKIILTNYRQFYGKCEINFATDEHQNITLIHGENGVGKTTLLNAVLWCFFEILTERFEKKKILVCDETDLNTCSVEIVFVSDNKKYSAIRHYKQKEEDTIFKMFEIEQGNYEEITHPKSLMNQILPQDMAEYFFFHGEGAAKFSGKNSGHQFRAAIRDILGFTFAEALIEDLKALDKEQNDELRKLDNISKQTKADAVNLALERDIEIGLRDKIESLEKKIDEFDKKEDKYNDKIKNSNNADASSLKKQILNIEIQNKDLNADLKRENTRKQLLIQEYGWMIFGQNLAKKNLDFIDELALRGRFPAPYDREVVEVLIEDGICMCGRELIEGTDPYDCILGKIEHGNTASEKNKLTKAKSIKGKILGEAKTFLNDVDLYESVIYQKESQITSNKILAKELKDALDEIKEEDISNWEKKAGDAKAKSRNKSIKLGEKNKELSDCLLKITRLDRQVKKGGDGENPVIKRILAYIELNKSLSDRTKERLEEFENIAKKSITKQVDRILEKWSRKDYRVYLSDEFVFTLVKTDGSEVAKSDGERLLLNLSFISALMNVASGRTTYNGTFLLKGAVAPFVIDAPFGELDKSYRGTTASYLPKNSRQLVLMLSTSHWEGIDSFIRDRIGKEYLLINNNKTQQEDQPDDPIEINGVVYNQSIYESEYAISTIKEVIDG